MTIRSPLQMENTKMQTTIESDSGWFRAVLEDTEDGVTIAIWSHLAGGSVWKPVHRETLDVPFHLACEEIIELNAEIKRAQDALAVGAPTGRAESVSVDPQELENLRTCAAIVSAIKVLG